VVVVLVVEVLVDDDVLDVVVVVVGAAVVVVDVVEVDVEEVVDVDVDVVDVVLLVELVVDVVVGAQSSQSSFVSQMLPHSTHVINSVSAGSSAKQRLMLPEPAIFIGVLMELPQNFTTVGTMSIEVLVSV
jgi:hypothetical protein